MKRKRQRKMPHHYKNGMVLTICLSILIMSIISFFIIQDEIDAEDTNEEEEISTILVETKIDHEKITVQLTSDSTISDGTLVISYSTQKVLTISGKEVCVTETKEICSKEHNAENNTNGGDSYFYAIYETMIPSSIDKEEISFISATFSAGNNYYSSVPVQYNIIVTFDQQIDGIDPIKVRVIHGETLKTPEEPSRNGFVFDGWFRDIECETPFESDTIFDNITLYAKWVKTYKVSIKVNSQFEGCSISKTEITGLEDGTSISIGPNVETVMIGEETITVSIPKDDSQYIYNFRWDTTGSYVINGNDLEFEITFIREYKPFEIQIQIDSKDKDICSVNGTTPIVAPYGSTIQIKDNEIQVKSTEGDNVSSIVVSFLKEGYSSVLWYTMNGSTKEPVQNNSMISGDMTIYASAIPIISECNVAYADPVVVIDGYGNKVEEKVDYDTELTVSAPNRDGFIKRIVAEITIKVSDEETYIQEDPIGEDGKYTVKSDVKFIVYYDPIRYNITLKTEGESGSISHNYLANIEHNSTIRIDGTTLSIGNGVIVTATPPCDTFDKRYTVSWSVDDGETVTSNMTITVTFSYVEREYTVRFTDNISVTVDGNPLLSGSTVKYNTEITMSATKIEGMSATIIVSTMVSGEWIDTTSLEDNSTFTINSDVSLSVKYRNSLYKIDFITESGLVLTHAGFENIRHGSTFTINDDELSIDGRSLKATIPSSEDFHIYTIIWKYEDEPITAGTPITSDMEITVGYTDKLQQFTVSFDEDVIVTNNGVQISNGDFIDALSTIKALPKEKDHMRGLLVSTQDKDNPDIGPIPMIEIKVRSDVTISSQYEYISYPVDIQTTGTVEVVGEAEYTTDENDPKILIPYNTKIEISGNDLILGKITLSAKPTEGSSVMWSYDHALEGGFIGENTVLKAVFTTYVPKVNVVIQTADNGNGTIEISGDGSTDENGDYVIQVDRGTTITPEKNCITIGGTTITSTPPSDTTGYYYKTEWILNGEKNATAIWIDSIVVISIEKSKMEYIITFNYGTETTSKLFEYGSIINDDDIPKPTNIVKEGKWLGFKAWAPELNNTVTGDVTYVAEYEECTPTLSANTVTLYPNQEISIKVLNIPSNTGITSNTSDATPYGIVASHPGNTNEVFIGSSNKATPESGVKITISAIYNIDGDTQLVADMPLTVVVDSKVAEVNDKTFHLDNGDNTWLSLESAIEEAKTTGSILTIYCNEYHHILGDNETLKVKSGYEGCYLIVDSLISSDGTYRPVIETKEGDVSQYTLGDLNVAPVMFNGNDGTSVRYMMSLGSDNGTYTLLRDLYTESFFVNGNNTIWNLNGYTLYVDGDGFGIFNGGDYSSLRIVDGNIVFTGNGMDVGYGNVSFERVNITVKGDVALRTQNGTIDMSYCDIISKGDGITLDEGSSMSFTKTWMDISGKLIQKNKGTISISDGLYMIGDHDKIVSEGTLTIYSGRFSFDPTGYTTETPSIGEDGLYTVGQYSYRISWTAGNIAIPSQYIQKDSEYVLTAPDYIEQGDYILLFTGWNENGTTVEDWNITIDRDHTFKATVETLLFPTVHKPQETDHYTRDEIRIDIENVPDGSMIKVSESEQYSYELNNRTVTITPCSIGSFTATLILEYKGIQIEIDRVHIHCSPSIKWIVEGTTVETDKVIIGSKPTFDGEVPSKEATETNWYSFAGWSEDGITPIEIPTINENVDVMFYAMFNEHSIEEDTLTVTWIIEKEEIVQKGVRYGTTPSINFECPSGYTFIGWMREGNMINLDEEKVTCDTAYIAILKQVVS